MDGGQILEYPHMRSYLNELHLQVGAKLARQDHRYTKGRRKLIEVIHGSDQPMTLPDIVAADPDLAPSSVYRNLDLLVRSGVVRRIVSGGDRVHFELAEPLLGHHHHMICIGCGTIEDIHLENDLENLVHRSLDDIAERTGFTPAHHSLDLHGHCADC